MTSLTSGSIQSKPSLIGMETQATFALTAWDSTSAVNTPPELDDSEWHHRYQVVLIPALGTAVLIADGQYPLALLNGVPDIDPADILIIGDLACCDRKVPLQR